MNKKTYLAKLEPISKPISFSRKTTTYNATYAYHRHDACEIYLFLSGNVHLYIEQTCFIPKPRSVVLLNPNEMHRIQCIDSAPYERIVINIKRSYIQQLSPEGFSLEDCFFSRPVGQQNLRVLSPEAMEEFFTIYQGLESSNTPDCFGSTVIQNAYASLLLLFLNRQFQTNPSTYKNTLPSYITGTMQYIESHLNEPLSLSTLAQNFHISESYLSSQFKYHTGLTLRSFLLDRKIQCAKTLLLQGSTVTDACYRSGFNDYANFIRSFTKVVGISPGKYRITK